jgi:hypothetical protein
MTTPSRPPTQKRSRDVIDREEAAEEADDRRWAELQAMAASAAEADKEKPSTRQWAKEYDPVLVQCCVIAEPPSETSRICLVSSS